MPDEITVTAPSYSTPYDLLGNFGTSRPFDLGLSNAWYKEWFRSWNLSNNVGPSPVGQAASTWWDDFVLEWEKFTEWWKENVKLKFGAAGWELTIFGISYVFAVPKRIRQGVKNGTVQTYLDEIWPFVIGGAILLAVGAFLRYGR